MFHVAKIEPHNHGTFVAAKPQENWMNAPLRKSSVVSFHPLLVVGLR